MHFLHRRGAAAAAVCASLSIAGWSAVAARNVERESRGFDGGGSSSSAAAASAPVEGYMVLLRWRDASGRDAAVAEPLPNETADGALAAHREYWSAQRDSGRVILTGAMKRDARDAAVIILRAPSQEAAERVAAADPAVRAGLFEVDVRALDVQLSRASDRPTG